MKNRVFIATNELMLTEGCFQATVRRFGRKLDIHLLRAELPLTPVFFGCFFAHAVGRGHEGLMAKARTRPKSAGMGE